MSYILFHSPKILQSINDHLQIFSLYTPIIKTKHQMYILVTKSFCNTKGFGSTKILFLNHQLYTFQQVNLQNKWHMHNVWLQAEVGQA